MVRQTLKILQRLLQNFESVPDHFGMLCIKELKDLNEAGILAPEFNPILRKN